MGCGQAGHNSSWWANRLRPDQPAWLSSLDEWDAVCAWHPWAVQADPIGEGSYQQASGDQQQVCAELHGLNVTAIDSAYN